MSEFPTVKQKDLGVKSSQIESRRTSASSTKEAKKAEPTTGEVIQKFLKTEFSADERYEAKYRLPMAEKRTFPTLEETLGIYAEGYISKTKLTLSNAEGKPIQIEEAALERHLGTADVDLIKTVKKRLKLAKEARGHGLPPDLKISRFKDPKGKATFGALLNLEYQVPETENERVFFILGDTRSGHEGYGPMAITRSIVYFDGEKYHSIYDSERSERLVRYRFYSEEEYQQKSEQGELECLDMALPNETWLSEIKGPGMLFWFHEEGHHHVSLEETLAFAWIEEQCGFEWLELLNAHERRGRLTQEEFQNLPPLGKLAAMVYKTAKIRSERGAWADGLYQAQIEFRDSKLNLDGERLRKQVYDKSLGGYERSRRSIPSYFRFCEPPLSPNFTSASWEMFKGVQPLLEQESAYADLSQPSRVALKKALLLGMLAVPGAYQKDQDFLAELRINIDKKEKHRTWNQKEAEEWREALAKLETNFKASNQSEKKVLDWALKNWRENLEKLQDSREIGRMIVLGYLGMYDDDLQIFF